MAAKKAAKSRVMKEPEPEWRKKLRLLTQPQRSLTAAQDENARRRGESYLNGILRELKKGRRQWKRGDKLLEAFGYTRRRQSAIDLINKQLKAKGLYTDPKLTTEMPLDRGITFYLKGKKPDSSPATPLSGRKRMVPVEVIELASDEGDKGSHPGMTVTIPQDPPLVDPGADAERSWIVGNLPCAERVPEQVPPSAPVEQALTKMALHDYSQLVVTTGPRDIKGIISYKSIAEEYLHKGTPQRVGDCLDPTVPVVDRNEPLLSVVARFNEYDAVLIIGPDRSLVGIVTPADIAVEFGAIAAPFLLIGEIEKQLRWLVRKNLPDVAEALGVVNAGHVSMIDSSVSDLTMGDLHRILDHDENWSRLGIKFDRREFCKELDAVREIRNAVMHFRDLPEGSPARLKRFASAVQKAYLRSAK